MRGRLPASRAPVAVRHGGADRAGAYGVPAPGTHADVARAGGEGITCPLDVADAQAVAEAAERIERELGPIDVWVNDAMAAVLAPVHETTAEEVRRVTEVTYLGMVHGTL